MLGVVEPSTRLAEVIVDQARPLSLALLKVPIVLGKSIYPLRTKYRKVVVM